MLRYLLLALAFYLLFRVIQKVLRYLFGGGKQVRPRTDDMLHRPPKNEPPQYDDVKDAAFKDLPNDKPKPS
jgi:hypothetical protein